MHTMHFFKKSPETSRKFLKIVKSLENPCNFSNLLKNHLINGLIPKVGSTAWELAQKFEISQRNSEILFLEKLN